MELSRRDVMFAGASSLVSAGIPGDKLEQLAAQIDGDPEYQGVADLIGPADGRHDVELDDKPFYAYRYKATDTGSEFYRTQADDSWRRLEVNAPRRLYGRAYVDHPEYGGDIQDALERSGVRQAILGDGNYDGWTTPGADYSVTGLGTRSLIETDVDANQLLQLLFFMYFDSVTVTVGAACVVTNCWLALSGGLLDVQGNGTNVAGNVMWGGPSVEINADYCDISGCSGTFGTWTLTLNGDNNAGSALSRVDVVDNGSGNSIGAST